jgi:MFS family permease
MNTNQRRLLAITSLTSIIEYYDFMIYALFASHLSAAFNTHLSQQENLTNIFITFAVGYISRPIGGIAFGIIGDIYGKKKVFLTTAIFMALSTFSIGLIPSTQAYSMHALFALRFIQGLSLGAELPGAVVLINDNISKKTKGLLIGIIVSSASLGAISATLVSLLLSKILTQNEVLTWGWRIPFLIGGILGIISFLIRKNFSILLDTKNRNINSTTINPLIYLLKFYPLQAVLSIGLAILISVIFVILQYLPSYTHTYFKYEFEQIYFALLLGKILLLLFSPIVGLFLNKKNITIVITYSIYAFICFNILSPIIIGLKNDNVLIIFFCGYQLFASILLTSYFYFVTDIFPSYIKYTSIASSYNLAYVIAAISPGFSNFVINTTNQPNFLFYILILISALSVIIFKTAIKKLQNSYN